MRCVTRSLLAAALLRLAGGTAQADYPRVELGYVEPPGDDLAAVVTDLWQVAEKRALTTLRPYLGTTFFWERDFGGGYRENDSALTNLIVALSLDDTQLDPDYRGSGWARLSGMLRTGTGTAHAERDGVVCLPAEPVFADEAAWQQALAATGSEDDLFQWGFVGDMDVHVYADEDAGAPVIATLRSEAVLALAWKQEWIEVELPDGRNGYVADTDLCTASPERLCFGRDASQAWKIVGYIGGGD